MTKHCQMACWSMSMGMATSRGMEKEAGSAEADPVRVFSVYRPGLSLLGNRSPDGFTGSNYEANCVWRVLGFETSIV